MAVATYIVTEFSLENCCCTSQADNNIERTFIGVFFTREELENFLRTWIIRKAPMKFTTESQIKKEWIDKIIEVGSVKDGGGECSCGLILFIDDCKPHTLGEDQISEISRDKAIVIKDLGSDEEEETELLEQILVEYKILNKCCSVKGEEMHVKFIEGVSESKLKELLKKYIEEYIKNYTTDKIEVSGKMIDQAERLGSLQACCSGCGCGSRIVIYDINQGNLIAENLKEPTYTIEYLLTHVDDDSEVEE